MNFARTSRYRKKKKNTLTSHFSWPFSCPKALCLPFKQCFNVQLTCLLRSPPVGHLLLLSGAASHTGGTRFWGWLSICWKMARLAFSFMHCADYSKIRFYCRKSSSERHSLYLPLHLVRCQHNEIIRWKQQATNHRNDKVTGPPLMAAFATCRTHRLNTSCEIQPMMKSGRI